MKDVKKRFGGAIALRGPTLSVRAGEIHALLGENGAGKSTMLKILAGVHEHDGGVITLGGAPFIAGSPQASIDQGIAVIYQEPSLFLDLSLAENIDQAGKLFQPLIDNQFFRKDLVFTKQYESEQAKGVNLRNNPNPKNDEKYWEEGMSALHYQASDFANSSEVQFSASYCV
jgi:ABC-type sugar transport system ATPase subunit